MTIVLLSVFPGIGVLGDPFMTSIPMRRPTAFITLHNDKDKHRHP